MRDSTHWLSEDELALHGVEPADVPCITVGGERRWNFWAVQDFLDERVRRRSATMAPWSDGIDDDWPRSGPRP